MTLWQAEASSSSSASMLLEAIPSSVIETFIAGRDRSQNPELEVALSVSVLRSLRGMILLLTQERSRLKVCDCLDHHISKHNFSHEIRGMLPKTRSSGLK